VTNANTEISNYTAVTTLANTDEFVVNDGGVTKKITHANLKANIAGKQSKFIPAKDWRPTITSGCAALAASENTAGRPERLTLDFDASSDEFAQAVWRSKANWDAGTLSFIVHWTTTATDADGVAWALQAVAVPDGTPMDVAFGTAVVVTDDAQSAATDVLATAESGDLTVAGSPTAGDLIYFQIFRDVSDANDDMTEDAGLIGVTIFFTTNDTNED
jgi:hypothetical protein